MIVDKDRNHIMSQNVYYLGVARIAGQGIVVASYSYNTETDIGGVKQVLEQPNMNMSPGKHYTFSVGQLAWHLIAGEEYQVYYVCCIVDANICFRRSWFDLHSYLRTELPATMRSYVPGGASTHSTFALYIIFSCVLTIDYSCSL